METGQGSGTNTDSNINTHPKLKTTMSDQVEKALVSSESFASTSSSDSSEDTFELNGTKNMNIATQTPPTQVMEPRIPASVFENSKSTQIDWSTASTESLFSIHMGNMSFNMDALSLLGKSGDLSENKPQEAVRKSNMSVGATEAAAAQTMKEVIRENEERRSKQQPKPVVNSNIQHYDDSAMSIQSFAFDPVLTTEGGGKHRQVTLTTSKSQQQTPEETETTTPKQQNPKPKKKWISSYYYYLSWCPCCK